MSSAANSAPARDTAPSDGATVTESSMRIRMASSASSMMASGSGGGGVVVSVHPVVARTAIRAAPDRLMCLRMGTAPSWFGHADVRVSIGGE